MRQNTRKGRQWKREKGERKRDEKCQRDTKREGDRKEEKVERKRDEKVPKRHEERKR